MAASPELTSPAIAAEATAGVYTKLSPGPGRRADEVAAHQRTRFHAAMIELVAERGYADVAVHDLAERAKVSSRAFYERFCGKEDCFLRTHQLLVRRTAKRVIAAQAGERDWHERLRLGFGAFVRELEREPEAMHLALVDAYLDGPAARVQARKGELLFATMLAESFRRAPDVLTVPPLAAEAIVAGLAEVARRHLLAGRRRAPAGLADELMEWTLARRERAAAPLPAPLQIPSSKPATRRSRSVASDRDLCLAAVEKLALTQGQTQLTVPRIRAAAGISRPRFHAEFKGAEHCIEAARAERLDPALARVERIRESEAGERGPGRAAQALCAEFAADPTLTALCFSIDCVGTACLPAGGEPGSRVIDRVGTALYGTNAARRPSVPIQAGAGMVWTTIGACTQGKRPKSLRTIVSLLAASS